MRRANRSLAALSVALLLGGCGSGDVAPVAGKEIVVLGVVGSSDQKNSRLAGMINGVRLAVDQYNDNRDSRYRIDLKELAGKPQPGEAGSTGGDITKTERLIGVIGPFTDQEVSDLGPEFEGAGMPFLVPPLGDTSISEPSWRSFRRLVANDKQEGNDLALYATKRVGGAIVVAFEDSGPGESFAAGAKESLDGAGRAAARTESVTPKGGYETLAKSLVEGGPEAILYGGGAETGAGLLAGLRKAGFQGAFLSSHQLRDANPKALGPGVVSASTAADPEDSAVEDFATRYKNRFDAAPAPFAVESFEGATMLLEAIEEVDAKPRDLSRFLQQNRSFLGDSKDYEFDEAGELTKAPIWIYESTNGAWRLTGRSDRLTAAGRPPA